VKTAAEIEGDVTPVGAETGNLEHLAGVPAEVEKQVGPIDILVTNTGGPPPGGALDNDLDEWQAAYTSLVLAPRVLIKAVAPGMRDRHWGRIVNVGSSSTRQPIPELSLSNVHRAAAVAFFKTLSNELAPHGITVNTVAPGFVPVERHAGVPAEIRSAYLSSVPAGRMGTPEDIAQAVSFFASEAAGFVTGQRLVVDGGRGLTD